LINLVYLIIYISNLQFTLA